MTSFLYQLTFLLLLAAQALNAQTVIDWANLTDVTFEERTIEDGGGLTYNHATFGASVIALDSQFVQIMGYLIPIDPMGFSYVLSQNPNASCFFCGGAGPETVIQLKRTPSQAAKRYKIDDRRAFTGILRLYEKDIDNFTYVLDNAIEQ